MVPAVGHAELLSALLYMSLRLLCLVVVSRVLPEQREWVLVCATAVSEEDSGREYKTWKTLPAPPGLEPEQFRGKKGRTLHLFLVRGTGRVHSCCLSCCCLTITTELVLSAGRSDHEAVPTKVLKVLEQNNALHGPVIDMKW